MLENCCAPGFDGCFDDRIIARSIIERPAGAVILPDGRVRIAKEEVGLPARRRRAILLDDKPESVNWLPIYLLLAAAIDGMAVIALKIVIENSRKIGRCAVAIGFALTGPPP